MSERVVVSAKKIRPMRRIACLAAALALPVTAAQVWMHRALAEDSSAPVTDSSPTAQQYAAVGEARTAADLAVRQARQYIDDNGATWRDAVQGTETARGQIDDALAHAVDMENRKPDDQKSQAALDNLNAQRTQLGVEWAKFANVTRANYESNFQRDSNLINELSQVYNNMAGAEGSWKDVGMSMPATAAVYQSIAARAGAIQADAAKQLSDLQAARKNWDAQFDAISKSDDGK